jgi:hypothetical protein
MKTHLAKPLKDLVLASTLACLHACWSAEHDSSQDMQHSLLLCERTPCCVL